MPAARDALKRLRQEVRRLPEHARMHVEQVRVSAVELARLHGVDAARAELAALAHDVCRATSSPELLRLAAAFRIPVTPLEQALPVFLHGPVGAEVLLRDYVVEDPEVLNAVRCHTMGRAAMTPLDKVLFLADKLDPSKVGRYPFIGQVAELARRDLDQAIRRFIDHQLTAFIEGGDLVHPSMAAARNDAVLRGRPRG